MILSPESQRVAGLFERKSDLLNNQVGLEQAIARQKELLLQSRKELSRTQSKLEADLKKASIKDISAKVILMLDKLQSVLYRQQTAKVEDRFRIEIRSLMRKTKFIDDIKIDDSFNIYLYRNEMVSRAAFYIPTEGFDSTMYAIARHCMSDNRVFLGKVDGIKKKLSITMEAQHSGFLESNIVFNKVVSTNAFPIAIPNQCYQFEVALSPDEKQWDFCKKMGNEDVMAVPYKNLIYAWGSKTVIEEVCRGKLKSNIELCPLSRAMVAGNSTFRELLLKTLVRILAVTHGLGYSKDKIWDTKEVLKCRIGTKTVIAYSGVRAALLFDNRYNYLTLVPSFI